MTTVRLVVGAVVVLGLASGPSAGQPAPALSAFATRVEAYATLHREIARPMPSRRSFTDPAEGLAAVANLRNAIRAARREAREGALFGAAAEVLRRDMRRALRQAGLEPSELIAEMMADREEGARAPAVNETFPWAAGNAMPPLVIRALPSLPAELEYRLVGPDLILIDIDANLVVDILRDALVDTTR